MLNFEYNGKQYSITGVCDRIVLPDGTVLQIESWKQKKSSQIPSGIQMLAGPSKSMSLEALTECYDAIQAYPVFL